MRRFVAVEEGLEPVRDALKARGFIVLDMETPGWQRAEAVVVAGMDKNLASYHQVETPAPVILAAGRTSEEVAEEVLRRLG